MNLRITIEFIILSPSKAGYYFAFSLRDSSEMGTKKAISPSPCEKKGFEVVLIHRRPCPELCNMFNLDTAVWTRTQLSGPGHRGQLRQSCSGL